MAISQEFLNKYYGVNKNIPIPLYYQLKTKILDLIQTNELKVGDCLPTEIDLCEALEISRPTVRQAIKELESEGYLYRKKGKGTFVAQPKVEGAFLNKIQNFNSEISQRGRTPTTKVISVSSVPAIEEINKELNLSETEELIELVRLRYVDDDAFVYVKTYISKVKFSAIMDEDFVNKSLYNMLDKKFGVVIEHVTRKLEAHIATNEEAEILAIPKKSAICYVKTIAYSTEEKPIEFSIAKYNGALAQFTVELYR